MNEQEIAFTKWHSENPSMRSNPWCAWKAALNNERSNKMNEELQKEFEQIIKPVMKFMADNFHPHVTVIVTPTDAELTEGIMSVVTTEFVKD